MDNLMVLSIEYDDVRLINDELDNYLKPLNNYLNAHKNLNTNHYPHNLFDEYPYFWDRLHEGDHKCSLKYADIYMAYLHHVLRINVADILWDNYQKTLQGDWRICYWQKEWLKHVFEVNFAKELRQFDEISWKNNINKHLSQISPNAN